MNKTSLRNISASLALLLTAALPSTAQTSSSEVEQLRASVKGLQEMVIKQNAQISRLEQQQGGNTRPAPVAVAPAEPVAIGLHDIGDGYIFVPGTNTKVRLNLSPRLDVIADSRNPGLNSRFAVALVPVKNNNVPGSEVGGYDSSNHTYVTGRGSNITFDAVTVAGDNEITVFYNNDFYDTSNGRDLGYRINHLYARMKTRFGKFTLGKTVSPFENVDSWPATLDYSGASAKVFSRPSMLRYDTPTFGRGFSTAFAISNPDASLYSATGNDGSVRDRLPDVSANIRWESEKCGSAQLGGIVRKLAVDGPVDDDVLGWGLSLSLCPKFGENDSIQLEGTYGEGIFSHINDFFRDGDMAFNSKGELKALTYWGFVAGYTHRWSPKYRSTASYSVSSIKNISTQAEDAYHRVQYASVNFVWTVMPRFDVGIEALYGKNKVKSGSSGENVRVQMTFSYSLF
ncbi:hypothetical protein M2103_000036 [Ereboglobus sp. PH5-5]|uniref:DcaP family trimeric outer membrane transporter n=1 Tax=Ereboglobus sp. PH5-5 TaxID=2940529 RepID=UPI002404E187|nr:DcaP family trimeric outer membrane transporter [Ereboglobus sp. PH5-5]MDF9831832.1 hypothetical protein [Ereboglobus sp. PH5-5]